MTPEQTIGAQTSLSASEMNLTPSVASFAIGLQGDPHAANCENLNIKVAELSHDLDWAEVLKRLEREPKYLHQLNVRFSPANIPK